MRRTAPLMASVVDRARCALQWTGSNATALERSGLYSEREKVNESNFGEEIEKHEAMIIDCYKEGHPESLGQTSCLEIAYARMRASRVNEEIVTRHLNVDENPGLCQHLSIKTAPTTLCISRQEIVQEQTCFSYSAAEDTVERFLLAHDHTYRAGSVRTAGTLDNLSKGHADLKQMEWSSAEWFFKKTIEENLPKIVASEALSLHETRLTKAVAGMFLAMSRRDSLDEEFFPLVYQAIPKGLSYLSDSRRVIAALHLKSLNTPSSAAFLTADYSTALSLLTHEEALQLTLMQLYLTPSHHLFSSLPEWYNPCPPDRPGDGFNTAALEELLDF